LASGKASGHKTSATIHTRETSHVEESRVWKPSNPCKHGKRT